MEEVSEDRRLFREAADLAIRLQNDVGNPVSVEVVKAWIGRSAAHEVAWAKVAVIHGMTGKILTDRKKANACAERGLKRRNFMIGGTLGIGTAVTGSLLAPRITRTVRADFVTGTAELKRVPLSDGSTVIMGPDSGIAVDFNSMTRRIDLIAGMAYFDVEQEAARPFTVVCGPVTAIGFGTAFDMSSDAGIVSLSVDHGLVAARSNQGSEQLTTGEWLAFNPESGTTSRGNRTASQIASWRNGMIVAENETVSALVARISRWQRSKVVIADGALGERLVSGVFDLTDPQRAIIAVVSPFGAKVRMITPFMTLIAMI